MRLPAPVALLLPLLAATCADPVALPNEEPDASALADSGASLETTHGASSDADLGSPDRTIEAFDAGPRDAGPADAALKPCPGCIAMRGIAQARVVDFGSPHPVVHQAVNDLRTYLGKATGGDFEQAQGPNVIEVYAQGAQSSRPSTARRRLRTKLSRCRKASTADAEPRALRFREGPSNGASGRTRVDTNPRQRNRRA